jgi:hypothetical protein
VEKNQKPLFIGGAVLLAAVAFMFGSSNSATNNNTSPAPEVTNEWTPEPEPVYTDEEQFLNSVNGYGNSVIANISDAELLQMGYQVCSVLDEGYTVDDIIYEFVYNSNLSSDSEYEAVGLLIGAAVGNLCPEYIYMVEDYF